MTLARRTAARPTPAWRPARFAGAAALVVATFAAALAGLAWIETWQAESFGDRRLAAPRPDECAMARAITADFAARHSASLRRAARADERKLELLAFAWQSDGERVPPGADWRKCPGLGRYVRSLGLERMASGGMGPALYISRAAPPAPGQAMQAWVTVFRPQPADPKVAGRDWTGATTWRVTLPPGRAGGTATWTNVAARQP